jgi:hypothetical protein
MASASIMGVHHISVIPIRLEPPPKQRIYDKPELLPGIWIEPINAACGSVAKQVPPDPTIRELGTAIVLDYPVYVRGLLERLAGADKNPAEMLKKLAQRHKDIDDDSYAEHPLEIDVQEEDIRKLVMVSCILADAHAVVINRPVLAEMMPSGDKVVPEFRGATSVRHVWLRPKNSIPVVAEDEHPKIDLDEVRGYCGLLERYFQPVQWQSGRVAVAIGAFLAYILGPDSGQCYLALMTVFEAILSTDSSEITHQISERVAFMLESTEDARYSTYKRMKQLYKTRSLLVHGAIINKAGVINYDTLRLDAKITIVPDADLSDIFDLCIRLFKRVLTDPVLLGLLEQKDSGPLIEHYLRLGFRPS